MYCLRNTCKRKEKSLQKNSTSNKTHELADQIATFFSNLFLVTRNGLAPFIDLCLKKPLHSIIILGGGYFSLYKISESFLHLRFLHSVWPELFSGKVLKWLLHYPAQSHCNFMAITLMWSCVVILGSIKLMKKKKIKQIFEAIGLTNKFGETPVVVSNYKIDKYQEYLLLNAKSISIDTFKAKQLDLEAGFGKLIESIKRSSNDLEKVEILFSSKKIPDYVHFTELMSQHLLKEKEFYLGENKSGVLTYNFTKMPHLMIAGTTGSGKSVFFKQVIASILKSTNHVQIYFVDLKNGLEAIDFKSAPNVAIAKNTDDAAYFLRKVVAEMTKRFSYLEAKGFKSIDPKRDKLDHIILAVDEASELYSERYKSDPDYELSAEIQSLTNSIARLGRAAGIHLILATQKVNKESINTIIQENVSCRMCFKMNTLQGSIQVLSHKGALDLPTTPGRGIWQSGQEEFEVQVPYLDGFEIQKISEDVLEEFNTQKKTLFQKMIGKKDLVNGLSNQSNDIKHNLLDIDP